MTLPRLAALLFTAAFVAAYADNPWLAMAIAGWAITVTFAGAISAAILVVAYTIACDVLRVARDRYRPAGDVVDLQLVRSHLCEVRGRVDNVTPIRPHDGGGAAA